MKQYTLRTGHYSTHQVLVRELKAIISPVSTVLDVGCNTGYLGEQVGRGVWTGIERDPDARAELEKIPLYKKIVIHDVEHMDFRQFSPASFDVVVLADVLEHLANPERILSELKNLIKQDGWAVISLPNVANWRIRLSLLFGFFSYTETGILDRTHRHLYEKHSARQLVTSGGFTVNRMLFTSTFFGVIIKILPFLGPLLGHGIVMLAQPQKEI